MPRRAAGLSRDARARRFRPLRPAIGGAGFSGRGGAQIWRHDAAGSHLAEIPLLLRRASLGLMGCPEMNERKIGAHFSYGLLGLETV
jgi:hypothetical protein